MEQSYEWQSRSGHSLGRFLQVVEELAAEDSIGISQSSGNAVQLMTIHKSKGLEFPLVVVMGLGEAWEKEDPYWLKIQNGDDAGFYYVGKRNQQPLGHSFFDQLRTRGKDNDARENERLLYVALTRAKHHLLLTGSRRADSKKKLGYWQHLKSCFEAQWQEASLNHWNYQSFEINSPWSSPSAAEAARVPDGPLLDRFPKSPSVSINKDLLTLAPARLLQSVPQEQESLTHLYAPYSQEVGLFIHELLEFAMEGRTCEPKALWEKYYKGMERERFDKIGSLAVRTTEAVYRHPIWNVFQDSLAIRCEQAVVHLHGNQLIRGSIDLLLERRPSHYLVVDYKTIPLPASSPYQQIIQEHRYDQQILAYIRAIKAMHPLAKVNGAVLFTHSQKLCLTHEEFEDQALIGQDTILRDSNHFQPELD